MDDIRLYELVLSDKVDEMGWINDNEFCVWVSYINVFDFMSEILNICGRCFLSDGGKNATILNDGLCVDLVELLGSYFDIVDIVEIFPKEQFKH